MADKRINKILWHGNELDDEGRAKAPSVAEGSDGLDGLNDGEVYICNADEDPAMFIRTDAGRVARVGGGSSGETYTREQIDQKLYAKVDTAFFSRLFGLMTDTGEEIAVNDVNAAGSSILAKFGLYTEQFLSALGLNPGGSGGGSGGATTLGELANVGEWADEVPQADRVLVQLAGATHWSSKPLSELVGLDEAALAEYLTGNGYATQSWVNTKLGSYATTSAMNSALGNKVDKVAGKGLSSNDFTDALLAKLNGIEEGANKYVLPTATGSVLGGVKVGATLAIASGVLNMKVVGTAGTYTKVTVDAYGRVTGHASLAATDIPNLPWSKITSGKPTTLAGYGITDAYTKQETDTKLSAKLDKATFEELFEKVELSDGTFAIHAKFGLYSDSFLSALGMNPDGGSGGASSLSELSDVSLSDLQDGQALTWDAAAQKWVNKTLEAGLDEEALVEYLASNNYLTATTGDNRYVKKSGDTMTGTLRVRTASNPYGALLTGDATNGYLQLGDMTNNSGSHRGTISGPSMTRISTLNVIADITHIIEGDIQVDSYRAKNNGTVPTTVALDSSAGITSLSQLNLYKSFLGSVILNGSWNHVISLRHRNGYSDGDQYGMYLRAIFGTTTSLCWNTQHSGSWGTERTLLDTANYTSTLDGRYVKKTGDTITGNLSVMQIKIENSNEINVSDSTNSNALYIGYRETSRGVNLCNNNAPLTYGSARYAILHAGNYTSTLDSRYLLNSSYTAADVLAKLKTVDGSGSGLDADTVDGYHSTSFSKRSNINIEANTTVNVEDFAKNTALTGEAGTMFSTTGWAWAESAYIKLNDSYTVDRMRYSILSYRNGSVNNVWNQQAFMFLPTYHENKEIYLVQMITNATADAVTKYVKRYTDYDTILASNVASATKLQTARTIWGQSFDGRANVSGNMTGVGSISASGNVTTDNALFQIDATNISGDRGLNVLYNGQRLFCGFGTSGTKGLFVTQSGSSPGWVLSVPSSTVVAIAQNSGINVGIGTTSPTSKLHVSGDAYASGYFKTNGWFQNNVNGCGLYNSSQNARWFANGGCWNSDKPIIPSTNNTQSVGTSSYRWNYGYFTNMHLNGGLNVNGVTTLNAAIKVPYNPGSWLNMATRTDLIHSDTNNSASSAHALFRLKDSAGNAIVFGGLGGTIGFYGYLKSRIDSNTNGTDWMTGWDIKTGALTHNKGLSVSGATTLENSLTVSGAVTLSSTLAVAGLATMNGGVHTPNDRYYSTFNTAGTYCAIAGIDASNYVFFGTTENTAATIIRAYSAVLFNFNGLSNSVRINKEGIWAQNGIWTDGYVSALGQTTTSDMRLKDKLADICLPVEAVAAAPAMLFAWKRNGLRDVGSSAQYWQGVLPEAVKERGGWLEMEYGNIALVSAISIAKKVVSHEERIAQLEKENIGLKNKIKELERRTA